MSLRSTGHGIPPAVLLSTEFLKDAVGVLGFDFEVNFCFFVYFIFWFENSFIIGDCSVSNSGQRSNNDKGNRSDAEGEFSVTVHKRHYVNKLKILFSINNNNKCFNARWSLKITRIEKSICSWLVFVHVMKVLCAFVLAMFSM